MSVGRPPDWTGDRRVCLAGGQAHAQVRRDSDRRAVLDAIIDSRGVTTYADLNDKVGYDTRRALLALRRAGWITLEGE